MRSRVRSKLLAILSLVALAGAQAMMALPSALAEGIAWSPPLNLFETTGRASEAEVVADPSGVIHVFWAYGAPGTNDAGNGQAIYYARRENGAWSEPVDVLTSPGDRVARTHSVAADDRGYLHIAWSGGDSIWYSRAYAAEAGSARGWSEPVSFVLGVTALEPCLAVGAAGEVYVVWTQARAGLMFARSADGGATWDSPRAIYARGSDTELVRWGRIAVDGRGRLHVALTHTLRTEQPSGGRLDPNYLYYLRSEDGGATWTDPWRVVEEPDFGEMNVITWGEDVVHLAWNGRAGRHGRYHRWSEDGGRSWSPILEIAGPKDSGGAAGLTGFPGMVADANGVVHLVSEGLGDHYFFWKDDVWSRPELVSVGITGKGVAGSGGSLAHPVIVLSEGNRLGVVIQDNAQRIWYTARVVDAPHVPPVALPARLSRATATPTAASSLALSPSPTTGWAADASDNATAQARPVLCAAVPTLALITIVLVVHRVRRRS